MSSLTAAAVFALATTCQSAVAPMTIVGIAQHESQLDPATVHVNPDGSADYGLMQINSGNFALLGLTAKTALDPCQSIAAAARLLVSFSRYNTGSPSRGIANGYAGAVVASIASPRGQAPVSAKPDPPSEPADGSVVARPVSQQTLVLP